MPFHPFAVHFPIAILIIAALFFVISRFYRKEFFLEVHLWLLALGIMSAGIAVISGQFAASGLVFPAMANDAFAEHQNYAYLSLSAAFALLCWRLVRRKKITEREEYAYLSALLLTVLLLIFTGTYGGEMVYRHGVGVETKK